MRSIPPTSAQVEINLPEMTKAIIRLARNKGLRRKFGANGLKRAKSMYDWSVVIPQMQSFGKSFLKSEQQLPQRRWISILCASNNGLCGEVSITTDGADFVKCRACDENHTIRDACVASLQISPSF